MAFLSSLNIPLSGMTAQRFRLDIIGQNVANAHNFATEPEDVYTRQMVVFHEDRTFKNILLNHLGEGEAYMFKYKQLKGVQATRVVDDPTPAEPVYSPNNPLADEYGYVYESNVDVAVEEMDAIEAQNSFNACKSMYEAMASMIQASLNIGKS